MELVKAEPEGQGTIAGIGEADRAADDRKPGKFVRCHDRHHQLAGPFRGKHMAFEAQIRFFLSGGSETREWNPS